MYSSDDEESRLIRPSGQWPSELVVRDESPTGVRFGVIRTVSSTGGVITAAGLIFAASMFGLLFATISMMVQAGFVLGMGILLDTFLVRTVTVPAIAAMVGRANWWPSRFRPQRHAPARGAAPATATQGPESETPSTSEQLILDLPSSVVHRQRKHAHAAIRPSDAHDGLLAAIGDPGRPVRPLDHAVRR